MKKAGSVLWGIVLIAAGVIWALNEFNVPTAQQQEYTNCNTDDVAGLFTLGKQANGAGDDNK